MALLFPLNIVIQHWSLSNRSRWRLSFSTFSTYLDTPTCLDSLSHELPMERERERDCELRIKWVTVNSTRWTLSTASALTKLPKRFHEPLKSAKGYEPLKSLQSAWRLLKEVWDSGMMHLASVFQDSGTQTQRPNLKQERLINEAPQTDYISCN